MYGDYDGLNKPPIFELHLGVSLWRTINLTDSSSAYLTEVITQQGSADFLHVCLINIGSGTSFISDLDLRPLKDILYPAVNSSRSLILNSRLNMGPTDNQIVRYPDDPYDRIWTPFSNTPYWALLSTNSMVKNIDDDNFEVPSIVMQTAVFPTADAVAGPDGRATIELYWVPANGDVNQYFAALHFSELDERTVNGEESRHFTITLNEQLWYYKAFTPEYLYSDAVYAVDPAYGYARYNISIEATANSTFPPILNAMEVFSAMAEGNASTESGDVDAMMEIKEFYGIERNWMGDPCAPNAYVWDGVACKLNTSTLLRVTSVNLSNSGLTGEIANTFGSLNAIEYLDLSYNNLAGGIPVNLADLLYLKLLDLTSNQLNGTIPSSLLSKSQNGSLTLRIGGNHYPCANETSCENKSSAGKKKRIPIPIIVLLIHIPVVLLLVVIFILCKRSKSHGSMDSIAERPLKESFGNLTGDHHDSYMKSNNQQLASRINSSKTESGQFSHKNSSLKIENRQFTYKELDDITGNFKRVLGKGGFGTVYHGYLENGIQVAVKVLSQSSTQGTKEFLAEVQHLTRVHHKNLVSMVGYCMDGDYLALVYEFMSEGTLQDHLRGKSQNGRALSWGQRLQIAVDAAQGLEYLHKGCKPPLVHRDVKTANILLSERFEAKIADFGLSKAVHNDVHTHVSTQVVGTPGYLDPEYYNTFQLSEKSDVFSFGVVILELITGQAPILSGSEHAHITHWVRQKLSRGDIEDIVDLNLRKDYDVNSIWKVADTALKCTAQSSQQRPTMTEVVNQLKESIHLESALDQNDYQSTNSDMLYTNTTDFSSQTSAFELENAARMTMMGGPVAR